MPIEEILWKHEGRLESDLKRVSTRTVFHCRAAMTTANVLIELVCAPVGIQRGVGPLAGLGDGWDTAPEIVKVLNEEAATLIIQLLKNNIT